MKENTERIDQTIHTPEFENSDIFKYGSFKDIKRTLENCTLGFSKLESYNDPFETNFRFQYHYVSKTSRLLDMERIKKLETTNADKIRKIAIDYLSDFMVTCFSSTPFEPLMWAHYADKHTGVCYCFDKKTIFDKNNYRSGLVCYSSDLPQLSYFETHSTLEQLKPQLENIIFVKSNAWAYEKEFRFFMKTDNPVHKFNPKSLCGVIVGARLLGKSECDEIEKMVTEYNHQNSVNVKVIYAHNSPNTFSMDVNYNKLHQKPFLTMPLFDITSPIIS